ncbi:MAG: hypothetical protein JWO36_140 [Myxococcales bacterium]|nr:hypothetical protein [Myxococcales bacterium]
MKLRNGMWVGLVVISACGSSNPQSAIDAGLDARADAPVDAVIRRTVSGILNVRHVTTTGEVVVPADLSAATVSVLALPSFTGYPGITNADGTFSIPDVPEGPFYLKLGNRYLEMSADTVDLSFDSLGRPGVAGATNPTNMTFNVTNLAAWQATDEIQMFSPGSGTIAFAMQSGATSGAPAVAATSLSSFVFDLSRASYRALIDGTMGDLLTMTQLATQTVGPRTFRTVARSFAPASFTITNGGNATLTGAFSTTATNPTFTAVWDRPAFDAELSAHSPRQTANNYSTLAVSTLPEAATRGVYHDAADLVVYAPGYTTDATAVSASWQYGDPYPVAWTRYGWCRYFTYRFIQLGSATPTAIFASMLVFRDLSTVTAQSPIAPIIGAVVSPKVNGMDAFGTLNGVGTTPTVSWTAPTLGVASRYYMDIYQVVAQNGATVLQGVARFETNKTQVAIPPAILTTGNAYVFEITARAAGTLDLTATPNAQSLPDASTRVTSSLFIP